VIERIRVLLDRPLEPALARAALVLAVAVGIGFAIIIALAGVDRTPPIEGAATRSTSSTDRSPSVPAPGRSNMPPQDPQDRPGSAAHRRAAAELTDHRALQHVPFEGGGVSIDLVGARGTRAVLRVGAATKAAARHGWLEFLRRFHDRGEAYVPLFEGEASDVRRPARRGARPGARPPARREIGEKRDNPHRRPDRARSKTARSNPDLGADS
jgi:hypothetical protein